MIALLAALAVAVGAQSTATGAGRYVYCATPSTSPRGAGLIITSVFRSSVDVTFIETAFARYLQTSYAPYGNGWIFSEDAVTCQAFDARRAAETQRGVELGRVRQPTQTVYNVPFQLD